MGLDGKVALVTGGSRGIGKAVALRLSSLGCKVVINYVNNSVAAEQTVAEIEASGGQGVVIRFDVADGSGVQKAVKDLSGTVGSPDILVNNAGITRDGLMARMKDDDWDKVLDTNLKGAFVCSKAVMRSMMKKRWGRIVNISSVIGFLGNGGQVNYAAAKAGMIGLTKSMARELSSRQVTVNAVAPGYIVTDMTKELPEDVQDAIKKQIPLGSLGTVEDVAGCVSFLVSDDAAYLTGQTIHVNGGMYMGN